MRWSIHQRKWSRTYFKFGMKKTIPFYTAIKEDVDVLITGDKDFSKIDVERPEILTPAQFLEKYLKP